MSISSVPSPGSKRAASSTPDESPLKKAKKLADKSIKVLEDHNKKLKLLMSDFSQHIAMKDFAGAKQKGIKINAHFLASKDAAKFLNLPGWIETLNDTMDKYMDYMYKQINTINQ